MHTVEPVSTIESTQSLVKNLDSTYAKENLKQVANKSTHINAEERTQLLILPKDFEELFNGTLGDWKTDTVNL